MLADARNGERRALLLERALAGGTGLETALQEAARAELWLTGALSSAKVLGVETGYLALPAPEPARADTAGGVVPADRVSRPISEKPSAPHNRRKDRAALGEQVVALVAELGPTVRQGQVAEQLRISRTLAADIFGRLQRAGRLRLEGYGTAARWYVIEADDEGEPEAAAERLGPVSCGDAEDAEEEAAPAVPEVPAAASAQDREARILAAIGELGPDVRNRELCVAAGVTVWDLREVLPALQAAGKLRVEGTNKARRLLLPGAEPPPRKRPARPPQISDATLERVLAGVRRLGPSASNGHLAALLGVNSVTVSQALGRLEEAGRLKRRVDGRQRQLEIVGERWETAEEAMARGVPVTRCPPAYAAPVTGAEERAGRLPHYADAGDWKAQRDAALHNAGLKR